MGATYTRQSSYSDGDTITAAHTNDEFNQLLAAFAASTGHTHDGTTAEGGPVTKLLGNTLTFGAGTSGTDITITFDGESNDGVLKWMEDEDYFEFSDDILVASTEKLQFRDTAIYINSSTDGQLDLVADTEIQIAATTVDINGNVDISGTLTIGSAGISEAELEVLDGLTVSTTEVNILDGDTSATSTTVADADRVVMNDNGTMVQVAVTDLAAYFDDEITAMPNLVTTAATTVGALDSGSITSGFGTIDTGSSTITTTGLITGGSLDIDDVVINGTTIGHTDDTDLITLANGVATVAGELSVTTLDIGGTNVTSTAAELNILDGVTATASELNIMDGVTATTAELNIMDGVTSTATELNVMDGDTSATSTTVADADRVVFNDAGTMKQVAVTDLAAYFDDEITAMPNLVTTAATTVGALDSGSITSGFGNIDIGSDNLTATGTVSLGATSFNDNAITNVGDIALDSISADGTDINVAVSDNSATAFTIKQGSDNYLVIDTANSSESVAIGTGISGTAISIGHSTSETTINDNLTVTGDLTVNGATTTVDTTNLAVKDTLLGLNQGASSNSNDVGIIIERGSTGNDALFMWDESEDKFALGTTTSTASSTGNLNMTTGTLVANIEGNVTGDVTGTATNATHVTVADNESTNEDNLIPFIEDTSATGNVGLESDGDLTYNPSTGRLTATQLSGTIQTAAQTNITSLGTLSALTVDNIAIDGTTIGHTSDTDLITLTSGVVTVAGEVSMTTLDIGGTNVTSTAAELNILDGVTSTATELNVMDGDTSATSTTLADADRLVTNDAGTMKQVALTDVKTYLTSAGFTTDDPTALAIALG